MTLRERIARAICLADTKAPEPDAPILLGMRTAAAWEARLPMADAAFAEIAAAGMVLVPREPTGEMLSAGFDARHGFEAEIYRAMLSARTIRG